MSRRHSYTLIAPFYDALVAPFTIDMRRRSLTSLPLAAQSEVLLIGIGSGLDLPLLPRGPRYTGLDLTPAMLSRARRKAQALGLDIRLDQGDARTLPYPDAAFDAVALHLLGAQLGDDGRRHRLGDDVELAVLQPVVHDEAHERLAVHEQALVVRLRREVGLGLARQRGVVAEQARVVVLGSGDAIRAANAQISPPLEVTGVL